MTTTVDVVTPRGHSARIVVRDQTSDLAVAGSVFAGVAGAGLVDEYDLASFECAGLFWDIGAHIGTVSVAVLLDNPKATAILIEPLPDNLTIIAANLAENGLADRAVVVAGAVGTDTIAYGFEGSETAATNRYIGNLSGYGGTRLAVRRVDIADLLAFGAPEAVKIDCEGGEYAFLDDPAVAELPLIFGEYHGSPERLRKLLWRSHEVTIADDSASTGLFRATRRPRVRRDKASVVSPWGVVL